MHFLPPFYVRPEEWLQVGVNVLGLVVHAPVVHDPCPTTALLRDDAHSRLDLLVVVRDKNRRR
eukprot:4441418-Prymnesium_polylepis.1